MASELISRFNRRYSQRRDPDAAIAGISGETGLDAATVARVLCRAAGEQKYPLPSRVRQVATGAVSVTPKPKPERSGSRRRRPPRSSHSPQPKGTR